MNMLKRLCALTLAGLLTACAHPIVISPDPASLAKPTEKIDRNVGLVISAADKAIQVTTPGGGGDNISYYPYKDLEFGIYSTLSSVFSNVLPLNSLEEKQKISQQNLGMVFLPVIQTTSSSESILTWPPTFFSVMIDYRMVDPSGTQLSSGRVLGEGRAEFSEFKSDFALAAKRAGTDALNKLKDKLLASPELRK
jgi:hypothetical protein